MSGCYKNLLKENEELKEQIEKMKICGNCTNADWKNFKCNKLKNAFDCIDNNRKHWELME